MERLIRYFKGIMYISLVSGDVGKFLSECVRKHIHISNIMRIDAITVEFSVNSADYTDMENIAEKLKCRIISKKEVSFGAFVKKYCKRKFFAAGFFLCMLFVIFMSSFISEIAVIGNENISEEEILYQLECAGFQKGMWRYGINVKKIQNSLMLRYDKLAWMWIDMNGTKATVSVQERISKPHIEDKNDYCNTVASADALITELMPRYGRPVVSVGDVVRKGDVLISGMSETQYGEIRYMHADGIVRGRTWYELDGVYNHTRYDRHLTGNTEKRYSITIGKTILPIFRKNTTDYELYEHGKNEQKIKFFKKTLPISFTIDTYCEIIETGVEISDKEVVDTAVSVLNDSLMNSLSDKKDLTVIEKTHTYEKLDSGNIYVKVRFECSEDIAEYKPIEHPEYIELNEQEEQ